jgi:hypothetical protein
MELSTAIVLHLTSHRIKFQIQIVAPNILLPSIPGRPHPTEGRFPVRCPAR